MNRLNDLYEQITPKTAPEELSRKVMNTEIKMTARKRPSKAVAAILAAAVSVSALTVTAGAANGWDYAGMFKSIFGEKAENITENIVTEATVLKDTIDTMDFELVAAAADKHSILAIVDVYSENGYKLVETIDGVEYVKPVSDLFIHIEGYGLSGSGIGVQPIEISEEKVRLAVKMSTEDSLKDKTLTFYARLENKKDENGEYIFGEDADYVWSAEFTADYSKEEIFYEKEISVFGAEIESIEVSPISTYFYGRKLENIHAQMRAYGETYVLLDNGEKVVITSITCTGYEYGSGQGLISFGYETPVNPENVSAVCIGGETIEIK